MRLTVLGGCGAWPSAGQACSGYLVEHEGFRVLIDPGYATLPRLLALIPATAVDAVLVSHGHPDHCADLNPLLRARALGDPPAKPLPVYALPLALDAVLALDRPGFLDPFVDVRPIEERFAVGPFATVSALLPHSVPNAGLRLTAGGASLVYTGDCGPSPALVELARGADLFLAEASFADEVPGGDNSLSSARDVARQATEAGVGRLLLTHLIPGTTPAAARSAAADHYTGPTDTATADLTIHIGQ